MVTVAAYFLTCCKPVFNSTFCFKVEKPKFLNLYSYPHEPHQYSKCYNHQNLRDHCLNAFNSCTDERAWALDDEQRRHHFLEISSGQIPLCGSEKHDYEEKQDEKELDKLRDSKKSIAKIKPLKKSVENKTEDPITIKTEVKDEINKVKLAKDEVKPAPEEVKPAIKEVKPAVEEIKQIVEQRPTVKEESKELEIVETKKPLEVDLTSVNATETKKDAEKLLASKFAKITSPPPVDKLSLSTTTPETPPPTTTPETLPPPTTIPQRTPSPTTLPQTPSPSTTLPQTPKGNDVTDEIMDKLDSNLTNLEKTFDKFLKKNRDFIQNLVSIVTFEKQKQKALETNYNKLKQDYDTLKTKNEYLMMVNEKQLKLFKNELDKEMSENKAVYKKKIQQLELQMESDQNTLKVYKRTERKFLEFVEKETAEVKKLKDDIKNLQIKEAKLLKNYVNVLNFLEEMKDSLNNCFQSKVSGFLPQQSSDSITAWDSNPSLTDVLKSALKHGIKSLNVRDLSILHDAIQELNDQLCHQSSFCGINPLSNVCISLSMICTEEYPVNDVISRGFQDYETASNLSIIPSRQRPDGSYTYNC